MDRIYKPRSAGIAGLLTMGVAALMLTGCQTTVTEPQIDPVEARRAADIQNLKDEVRALQDRLATIQSENQALARDIETLQKQMRGGAGMSDRVGELEKKLLAAQKAREQDRSAIVDDITRKVSSMVGGGKTASRGDNGGEVGYEHQVQAGQSLSEIAQAYGVSVNAIMKANRMKGKTIRVGQKLFIPEK